MTVSEGETQSARARTRTRSRELERQSASATECQCDRAPVAGSVHELSRALKEDNEGPEGPDMECGPLAVTLEDVHRQVRSMINSTGVSTFLSTYPSCLFLCYTHLLSTYPSCLFLCYTYLLAVCLSAPSVINSAGALTPLYMHSL